MHYRPILLLGSLLVVLLTEAVGAQKSWVEVTSPHFFVLTNGTPSDARHVAHDFEQMRFVFADRYPQFRLNGGAPLVIFAAHDETTAKALMPLVWKDKRAKPLGSFFQGWEKEYAMVRMDEWNQGAHEVVYHEYTHSILHLNLHWLPLWLDEGMANFYGYTRFQGDQIFVGAAPPSYTSMPSSTLIPIETLIGVDQNSPYYRNEDKVYQFYAESWALVHFMMFGPGMDRGRRLNQFSALLQQGMEQKKAFQQVFGDSKQMEEELREYIRQPTFRAGVVPNAPKIDEKSFLSHTLSLAETEAELASFHLWTHDVEGARPLAEQAVKDDPKLGHAHEVMGFLNFADGKDVEAYKEFSQACVLDPNLPLSLFAKTMMSPIATSDDLVDQHAFYEALAKVLALNPNFAPVYVQLAKLALRRNDLEGAFGLSRRAEELEPTRACYHLLSGQILRREGKGLDAAKFAKFVAERWLGADHNEAVELWNAVPSEQRPSGDSLFDAAPKDTQTAEGRVKSVTCAIKEGSELTINRDDQMLTFHGKGSFSTGFSDTIWYGEDHFTLCHHVEGMRAIVRYHPVPNAKYVGDITEIEIRDDLPLSIANGTEKSAVTAKP